MAKNAARKIEELFVLKRERGIKVSAIVPVYCEEKTVGGVLKSILNHPLIDEVVCVDDASEDKSLEILKSFDSKIKLVVHKRNRGKGAALTSGIKEAKGDVVCFFDADLLNLSSYHIAKLLEPILRGEARSVVGYPKLQFQGFKSWSGERAYWRVDLLPFLKEMSSSRFGVEIYLNERFKNKVKFVNLIGLEGYYKFEKFDFDKAMSEYIKLVSEVTRIKMKMLGVGIKESREILRLFRSKDVDDFRRKAMLIKNDKIRSFLTKNVLRYLSFLENRWRSLSN